MAAPRSHGRAEGRGQWQGGGAGVDGGEVVTRGGNGRRYSLVGLQWSAGHVATYGLVVVVITVAAESYVVMVRGEGGGRGEGGIGSWG